MTKDVVRALGFLCLGTRMKRIGERLQASTQDLLAELDVSFVPGQYPFLAAVDRLGPLTVGELAEAVGITQPGTTKAIAQLTRLGLMRQLPAPDDQRRRIVNLTEKGQRLVDLAKRDVWPQIGIAVADLCAGLDGPLLDQLAAIEDGLDARPLKLRAGRKQPAKRSAS